MQEYTLSFHNGSTFHQGHNRRDKNVCEKEEHIDLTKFSETLIDNDVKEFYKKFFEQSLNEYNEKIKKKHPERVKTFDEFYQGIKNNQNKKNATKLVYEAIIQLGNAEKSPSFEDCYQIYVDYVSKFEKRNPNLKIIGAYLHADEEGAFHLHLDYVPVAECKRGMKIQNNLTQALLAQSFKSEKINDTAQMKWEKSEREYLTSLCKEIDIEIVNSKGGKKHEETKLFKIKKRVEELEKGIIDRQNKINELNKKGQQKVNEYNSLLDDYNKLVDEFNSLEDIYTKMNDYWLKHEDMMLPLLEEDAKKEYMKLAKDFEEHFSR